MESLSSRGLSGHPMVQPVYFRVRTGFIQASALYEGELRRRYEVSSDSEACSVPGRALSGQPAMVRQCSLLRRNRGHRRVRPSARPSPTIPIPCFALCPAVPSPANQPWYASVRCYAVIGVIVGCGRLQGPHRPSPSHASLCARPCPLRPTSHGTAVFFVTP